MQDETGDTGLYLMGHRWMDPTLGRFINRDPIGFAGGLNMHVYAQNSPVGRVDPEGLNPGIPGYEYWGAALPYVREWWHGSAAATGLTAEVAGSGQVRAFLSPSALSEMVLGRAAPTAATANEGYLLNTLGGRVVANNRAGGIAARGTAGNAFLLTLIGVGVYTNAVNIRCQRAINAYLRKLDSLKETVCPGRLNPNELRELGHATVEYDNMNLLCNAPGVFGGAVDFSRSI